MTTERQSPVRRCDWAAGGSLETAYHDREWGVPVHDDRVLFEFLLLEGAQAGLSWSTILRKREAYRAAFSNFDPESVAAYGERERAALRKIDRAGLDRYASWLEVKRRKRLNRAFPTLFAAERQVIGHCFGRYVSLYVHRPNQLVHQEVEDFGRFAEQYLDAATDVPDWLSELVRYERMRYVMTRVLSVCSAATIRSYITSISSRPFRPDTGSSMGDFALGTSSHASSLLSRVSMSRMP